MLLDRKNTVGAFAPMHSSSCTYGTKYGIIGILGYDWRNLYCFKIIKLRYRRHKVVCCSACVGTTVSETKHFSFGHPLCFRIIED